MNGPVPIIASGRLKSLSFSSTSRGRIATKVEAARWFRNGAEGSLSVMRRVWRSTTSTDWTDVEARAEGRLGHEPLDRVLRVVGRDLAPVDRRLVVELDALLQRELDDGGTLVLPLLGEVGDDREIGRVLLLGAVRIPHELAVDHVGPGVRQEADAQVRVEVRRLPVGDPEDATAPGLLAEGGLCDEHDGDQRDEGEGEASSHDWILLFSKQRPQRPRKSGTGPERLPHYAQDDCLVKALDTASSGRTSAGPPAPPRRQARSSGFPSRSSARSTLMSTANPFLSGSRSFSGWTRRCQTSSYAAPDLWICAMP